MQRRRIITSLRSRSLRQMKIFEGQSSDKCHSTHKPFQIPKWLLRGNWFQNDQIDLHNAWTISFLSYCYRDAVNFLQMLFITPTLLATKVVCGRVSKMKIREYFKKIDVQWKIKWQCFDIAWTCKSRGCKFEQSNWVAADRKKAMLTLIYGKKRQNVLKEELPYCYLVWSLHCYTLHVL